MTSLRYVDPSREPVDTLEEPLLSSSAMHQSYGSFLHGIFSQLFGGIEYPCDSAERLRVLAQQGTVIYVARATSAWVVLYYNHVLSRLGLPLAHFVGGVNLVLWQPVDRLWKLWRKRSQAGSSRLTTPLGDRALLREEAVLLEAALRGVPAFISIRSARKGGRRNGSEPDYIRTLVAAQRLAERPIFLVPHVLTDPLQGGVVRTGLRGRLLGDRRHLGRLQQLAIFASPWRRDTLAVRVGEALDLRQLLAAHPEAEDAKLARRVRHELRRRISEEERVVAGPMLQPYHTLWRRVSRDPELRKAIAGHAARSGKSATAAERLAKSHLRNIGACYNPRTIQLFGNSLNWVFNRIYDGLVVDEQGLKRVVQAARRGPVVYCPSHRSHVDYLVLSYLLYRRGITPPHIAAGANLSFFPLGSLFRHSGAFFLRRAFKEDVLYRTVFEAYVTELVREGTSIELFLEGTRSRSGKMLLPKFGLLNMVVRAWRQRARQDVIFVPVAIDYERIIEAGSYQRELSGFAKRPEDLGALLRTTKVLRSRYGRVHLQFGEPISLSDVAKAAGLPQSEEPSSENAWRRETERLGFRIVRQVGTLCTVTSTAVLATALMGHRSRGLARGMLLRLSHAIIDYLKAASARISPTLAETATREAAIMEAAEKLVEEGKLQVERAGRSDAEPIYCVPEDQRVQLDYHKNALMNHFAPEALVARALERLEKLGPVHLVDLRRETRFLSRLFKREFIYRVDVKLETHLEEALGNLAQRGYVELTPQETVAIREPKAIYLLSGLLDNFFETYFVVASSLEALREFPMADKEVAARALEQTRRAYLEGTITRAESASKTLIETALAWMVDSGVVHSLGDGKRRTLKLDPEYDRQGLRHLIDRIQTYM